MRMTAVVEPAALLETGGFDDERLALPPADRVPVPSSDPDRPAASARRYESGGTLEFLEQEDRLTRRLQDLEREARNRHRIGHAVRHTESHRPVVALRVHAVLVEFGSPRQHRRLRTFGQQVLLYRIVSARQMPDRSGLLSAVCGVGAFRFGFPSAVRGVPGSGTDSHWAAAVPPIPQMMTSVSITSYQAGFR